MRGLFSNLIEIGTVLRVTVLLFCFVLKVYRLYIYFVEGSRTINKQLLLCIILISFKTVHMYIFVKFQVDIFFNKQVVSDCDNYVC